MLFGPLFNAFVAYCVRLNTLGDHCSHVKATIARKTGISTFNTYGPDHPQAIVPGRAQAPADIDF